MRPIAKMDNPAMASAINDEIVTAISNSFSMGATHADVLNVLTGHIVAATIEQGGTYASASMFFERLAEDLSRRSPDIRLN